MAEEKEFTEIYLSILGYQEDEGWVALALEMDLRGYGATFEDAARELKDLVEMQISFALFKGQPEMIWHPSDPVWFERFAEVRQDRLRHLAVAGDEYNGEFKVRGMPIPPPHVIASLKSEFERADA